MSFFRWGQLLVWSSGTSSLPGASDFVFLWDAMACLNWIHVFTQEEGRKPTSREQLFQCGDCGCIFTSSWVDSCHLCAVNPAVVSGIMFRVRLRLQGLGCRNTTSTQVLRIWPLWASVRLRLRIEAALSPEALSLGVCSSKTSPSSKPWFPQKNLLLLD